VIKQSLTWLAVVSGPAQQGLEESVECGVAFFAGVVVPLHQIPKPEVSLSSA
jgi:hypothetical protein